MKFDGKIEGSWVNNKKKVVNYEEFFAICHNTRCSDM